MSTETQASGPVVEFPKNAARKPRLALMGEFSAGKSTLANLLVGADRLPVQVTATQLPPVWISYGTAMPYRVDLTGRQIPITLARLTDVPIAETAYVRIFQESQTLAMCEIIDMPGISDPNMPTEVWQRVLTEADGVIWCTHATQAWRQSENAIWATMDPDLRRCSLLLLTRIDKIVGDSDRQRIIKRLRRETAGLFARDCLPISLTQALAGQDNASLWQSSGAAEFTLALRQLVSAISVDLGTAPPAMEAASLSPATAAPHVLPRRIRVDAGAAGMSRRPVQIAIDSKLAVFRAVSPRNEE